MSKTLIAIPAYNCEKQIVRVLDELLNNSAFLRDSNSEILVIENRSTDETVAAVTRHFQNGAWQRPKRLIQNPTNLGLGGSQKVAFETANAEGFDFLFILHGDHQASVLDLEPLYKKMLSLPNAAAILGSRFSVGSKRTGYSKVRTIGNIGLNQIYSFLTFRAIQDLGSGLNLFRVDEFELGDLKEFSNHFTFNMDLLLYLVEKKKSFVFSPIRWAEVDQVSNARNVVVGFTALRTLFRWKFRL